MILAAAFNPTATLTGSFNAPTLKPGGKIIVVNKSYVDVIFKFANGDERLVIANDRRGFTVNVGSSVVTWRQQNIDYPQTVNQLENIIYVEVYEPSETIIESYPNIIQREALPTLVPYNIGFGLLNPGFITPGVNRNIYPSSYAGITVAPTTITNGANFDHYYSSTVTDIPGTLIGTGKTGANLTATGTVVTNFPGPFSLSGLPPIDTSAFFNNAFWQFPNPIPWASSVNGFLVDFWVNLPTTALGPGLFQNLFGDGNGTSNGGLNINITPTGVVTATEQFVGGSVSLTGVFVAPSIWHHIALLYTGTTTNTLSLWIDGLNVAQSATSGAPVNQTSPFAPRIGSNTFFGGSLLGQMANIGVQLTYNTTNFMNQPANRYAMGQQSLNVDYQNVWLLGYDIITSSSTTTTLIYFFSNLFQPAGLLYSRSPAQVSPIHPAPGLSTINGVIPGQPATTTAFIDRVRFPNALTHVNDSFILFSDWINTGPHYTINLYGYNMLGLG